MKINNNVCMPIYKIIGLLSEYREILVEDYYIIIDDENLYFNNLYYAKKYVEDYFNYNINIPSTLKKIIFVNTEEDELKFTDKQLQICNDAQQDVVTIITGEAGTGKTTIIKRLVEGLIANGITVKICCYTGKACEVVRGYLDETYVISKYTENSVTYDRVCTLHSLIYHQKKELDISQNKVFEINEEHEKYVIDLKSAVYIFDEASFIDLKLFSKALKCLGNSNLILSCDINQLPPILSGRPVENVIRSEKLSVRKLTDNFRVRQNNGSQGIIYNSRSMVNDKRYHITHGNGFEYYNIPEHEVANYIDKLKISYIDHIHDPNLIY